ncbi:DcaP family trimeric outer membrane transporter [Sphingomonas sp. GM_Shp_2]|uniref:DcaP family trimeric outer membrane transporter n=1 Tax=Sphingomonas sp. GM_Shp_2 TaxID=2937380 RepID=UPI002269C358|nr:DcaP family trimeric outer membrane transporter [Sphingomonas sp. GM_Shp_2]
MVMLLPMPAGAQAVAEDDLTRLRAAMQAMQARIDQLERRLAAPAMMAPTSAPAVAPRVVAASPTSGGVQSPDVTARTVSPPAGSASVASQGAPAGTGGNGFRIGATDFKIAGFVKGDMLFSRYSAGDSATNVLGRDFALAQSVPVGGVRASGLLTDAHAKQSRLGFQTSTPLAGSPMTTLIEMDFQVQSPPAGTERALNPYTFGLRRAVLGYRGFAAGQDWSTFQFVGALPETADFLGVTEGTVFVRQMVARYTQAFGRGWSASVSIENPETVTVSRTAATLSDHDDDSLPDLAARVGWKGDGAELSLAGVLRAMRANPGGTGAAATAAGWGLSIAGVASLPTGKGDDVRFMLSGGRGVGRYVGVSFTPDAVYDVATAELDPVGMTAGFAAYRHYWTTKLRSTAMGSYQRANNPLGTSPLLNRLAYSVAANLFWSPLPKLDLGAEFRHTYRELESGVSGTLDRLQFTVKQGF